MAGSCWLVDRFDATSGAAARNRDFADGFIATKFSLFRSGRESGTGILCGTGAFLEVEGSDV